MIINAFKNEIYSFYHEKSEFEDEDRNDIRDKNSLIDYKKLDRLISLKERNINDDLIRKHFQVQNLSTLFKTFFKSRNQKRNNNLTNLIKSGLRDSEEEITQMSRDEIEIKQPNEIVNVVKMILEFNNQNQEGKGLKRLTPDQMISRLPVSLAQLKAGNNSEKLKNELRKLL